MATKKTEPADAVDQVDEPAEQLPTGTVVRHADAEHRYALLVGYDDDGHALVVDLPHARAHHPGVVRA